MAQHWMKCCPPNLSDKSVFVNYATQPYKSLMQMARAKRVDLFPGFSYEMQFLSRNDGVAL